MIKKCYVCGKCSLVNAGNGDQLAISHGVCGSPDCQNIYRVWSESQFIHGAYSIEAFAKQIFEERRRAK